MQQTTGHLISEIQPDSIAAELGLQPGDRLLLLDGQPVLDVFDYRLRQLSAKLLLTIQSGDGEIVEYDIEKDEDEDLGLEFANTVMTECADCRNHCVFCFIDQLPKGMRSSLYFKDDDLRLSFLTGNYVTLTNISDEELDRLIACRLSPVNLSVHTTNPELRLKMLRQRQANSIMERMNRIAAAGLALNVQIVLCPGMNDGVELFKTLEDLIGLGPVVQSIAIVPVGLTRYREINGLYPLRPLEQADAEAILDQVIARQQQMLAERQTRLVYAADEIYLKAGHELPDACEFEDFPQLENGVGMTSLLRQELAEGLQMAELQVQAPRCSAQPSAGLDSQGFDEAILVTGIAAEPILQPWLEPLAARSGLNLRLVPVTNNFFGERITVAGLLTGQDIAAQLPTHLAENNGRTCLILPACLLKADEDIMLDDYTVQRLSDELATPILVCDADAAGLIGLLDYLRAEGAVSPRAEGSVLPRAEGAVLPRKETTP